MPSNDESVSAISVPPHVVDAAVTAWREGDEAGTPSIELAVAAAIAAYLEDNPKETR